MRSLEIENFKAFLTEQESIKIEFEEKNFLLYGDNGAGKSSLYEALKLSFYHKKLLSNLENKTAEEEKALYEEYIEKYTNTLSTTKAKVKLNEKDFQEFDSSTYNAFMLTYDDLIIYDEIRLDSILKTLYFFDDVESFCKENYESLIININTLLQEFFNEDIQIDIDAEDEYKIRIKNKNKKIPFKKSDIKKYFNEARLNLVVLLLAFESIKLIANNSKNILVLDDIFSTASC